MTDVATVRVSAARGRTWLFVQVTTDSGEVGVGKASHCRMSAHCATDEVEVASHDILAL